MQISWLQRKNVGLRQQEGTGPQNLPIPLLAHMEFKIKSIESNFKEKEWGLGVQRQNH